MGTDKKLVQIRLSQKLHKELKEIGKREQRSIANLVEVVVTRAIEERRNAGGEVGGDITIVPTKKHGANV